MLNTLKIYAPKLRYVAYALLFFWLLTGCTSSIGVRTEMQKTKTLARTSTGLTASIVLEDLKLTNKPTPTD